MLTPPRLPLCASALLAAALPAALAAQTHFVGAVRDSLTGGPSGSATVPLLPQPAAQTRARIRAPGLAVSGSPIVRARYLGLAGWEITDGRTVILVDPYVSRIGDGPPGDGTAPRPGARSRLGPDDVAIPDTAAIDSVIDRADFILITHGHYVHLLDAPYVARTKGAILIGNESVTHIAQACGVPEERLISVRGGEDYEFGTFSLRVIPSLHSASDQKRYFSSAVASRNLTCPLRFQDFVEGGTVGFLIRLGGIQILVFGSMNFVERELEGLRPDVAILPASSLRLQIHDYTGRLMRVLGAPRLVLATHWDNARLPYGAPQDSALLEAQRFAQEIRAASPKTRVVISRDLEAVELRVATKP
jgi:L-ascorbate metabolism protein UlaG (beta-lactamase superfamily)